MNKRKLNKVFQLVKETVNLDYAITDADKYGDCNSCLGYAVGKQFGLESKGIYTKHWLKGMNKGQPWKYLDCVYIGHDITEQQANVLIELFDKNGYNIEPKQYDESKCFKIWEKY